MTLDRTMMWNVKLIAQWWVGLDRFCAHATNTFFHNSIALKLMHLSITSVAPLDCFFFSNSFWRTRLEIST